jgi:hypothetical protein
MAASVRSIPNKEGGFQGARYFDLTEMPHLSDEAEDSIACLSGKLRLFETMLHASIINKGLGIILSTCRRNEASSPQP